MNIDTHLILWRIRKKQLEKLAEVYKPKIKTDVLILDEFAFVDKERNKDADSN